MVDAAGQSLAYFYARENDNDAHTAGVLTMDEARRLASNFATGGAREGSSESAGNWPKLAQSR